MRHILSLLILLVILSACSSGGGNSVVQPTGTTASFSGEVDIIYPTGGTVIYAEALIVTGTLYGADNQTFIIQLVNPDAEVIAETTLTAQTGEWQVEIPHGYTGDPTAITIRAVPNDSGIGAYDSVAIFMADLSFRPEGTFATIRAPEEDAPIGGGLVLVDGTASGLSTNMLLIALVDAGGNSLSEQTVELFNPFFIDEIPWEVELSVGSYTGNAQIQVSEINTDDSTQNLLTSLNITIDDSAG